MRRLTAGPSVRSKLLGEDGMFWVVDSNRVMADFEGIEEPDKNFLLHKACRYVIRTFLYILPADSAL